MVDTLKRRIHHHGHRGLRPSESGRMGGGMQPWRDISVPFRLDHQGTVKMGWCSYWARETGGGEWSGLTLLPPGSDTPTPRDRWHEKYHFI